MKRAFSLSIGIVTLAALPALAADLPPRMYTKAPVVVATAYNWSGCYIGGNVGGKWGNTTGSVSTGVAPAAPPFAAIPGASVQFDSSRTDGTFIGGGQIGCNWQTGNWVLGLEGDADWQRMRQTRTLAGTAVPLPFLPGDSFDVRSNWQASARARLGYAWDRMLLYVTGGAAFTDLSVGSNFIASGGLGPQPSVDRKTLVGATFGGGLEYAFTNNWSFGVEARYSWYGTQTFNTATLQIGPPPIQFAPVSQSIRYETFEVTGRLNWKFDWGPVVARY